MDNQSSINLSVSVNKEGGREGGREEEERRGSEVRRGKERYSIKDKRSKIRRKEKEGGSRGLSYNTVL